MLETHLQVSLSSLQAFLVMGTFSRILALAGQSFPVAGVLLGQAEQSVNGTLVCGSVSKQRSLSAQAMRVNLQS